MKTRVLYVDDEQINLMLFKANFEEFVDLDTAISGEAALKLLENKEYDIIISDMKMPGLNGLEFISEAKKIKPQIKCYLLTGFNINEEIEMALNNKLIIECFGKPFDNEKIIAIF